jgi:NAD(P)-dependent dehydrogenase (short-subunit alcohol dehydrogenase family)
MRNALVTGVSRRAGIGFAITRRLEDAGAHVFTQGWTPHDAAQPWGADETVTPAIEADFADPAEPKRVVTAARDALGPLETLTLAEELADRGITVNCINPGPTETGWGLADIDPKPRMPFGRWGEPDDAARLVAWLCSDDGRWITGQVIDSESGFRRWA